MKIHLEINLDNRKLVIKDIISAGSFLKFRGLMFRSKSKAPILLFNTPKRIGIHSYFVFFKFLTLWLDDKNNVLDYKIVNPFTTYVKSNKSFTKILEIPLNGKYHSIVSFVVGSSKSNDGETFKKK